VTNKSKGACVVCFDEVSEVQGVETKYSGNKGFRPRSTCSRCQSLINQFGNDHEMLLRAACFVIVQKAGLPDNDIRVGYRLLFEEEQRKSLAKVIKRKAKEQLCQAKSANADEDTPTVEPVGPGMSTEKDSVL